MIIFPVDVMNVGNNPLQVTLLAVFETKDSETTELEVDYDTNLFFSRDVIGISGIGFEVDICMYEMYELEIVVDAESDLDVQCVVSESLQLRFEPTVECCLEITPSSTPSISITPSPMPSPEEFCVIDVRYLSPPHPPVFDSLHL